MNDWLKKDSTAPNAPDQNATVRSVQVGRVATIDAASAKPWTSAIVKSIVDGPVRVGELGLDGDEQADLVHHGGPDKAVLAYSAEHDASWENELGESFREMRRGGGFGENLTIVSQTEQQVCIGDVVEIGSCRLQVSQPRQPCWKLSKRWRIPKLAVNVQKTGRTGWYYRVLREGIIRAGDPVRLLSRKHPNWTVSQAHAVMHARPRLPQDDLRLASCPELSESWRHQLQRRATRSVGDSSEKRLLGNPEVP